MLREQPYGARRGGRAAARRDARRRLRAAVPTARFFVAASDGVDAAVTTLYSDGVVAQVEDVGTLRDYRRRGLARGDGDARRSTRRSRWATS